ncbi:MarR family transcriptional regulator [Salinisphaera aquimarina]
MNLRALFEDESLGAPENAVGFVLWRVMHRYVRAIDRQLAPVDLTHLQFTTLAMVAWLARDGGAPTQTQVALAGNIHAMQVSNVIKALETKRFVARTPNPADSRAKCLHVTDAGLQALRSALPIAIEVQKQMFGADGQPGGPLLDSLRAIDSADQA